MADILEDSKSLLPCPRCKADGNRYAMFYKIDHDVFKACCSECGWTIVDWDQNLPLDNLAIALWNKGANVDVAEAYGELRLEFGALAYDMGKFLNSIRPRLVGDEISHSYTMHNRMNKWAYQPHLDPAEKDSTP